MAKRLIASLDTDFSNVVSFLQTRGVVPDPTPRDMIECAKRIHRCTYSLILWRFRLRGIPDHGRVFVEEIASDALQILPQTLMGYGKTAKLLTRGIIENVMRHLYFSDHPVEFARMNRESKWFMTMESLFEYPKIHTIFMESERRFDAINRLSSLYSELSAGVHGRRVRDLETRTALRKINYDGSIARLQADLAERCAEAANFVLAMFHSEQLSEFQIEDRRIILGTMSIRARQIWHNSQ